MKEVKNFQKSLLRNRRQIYKDRMECLIWTMKNILEVMLFTSIVKSFRGSLVVKTWCHTYLESLDVMSDFETPRQRIQSGQEMMTQVSTALERGTELHHHLSRLMNNHYSWWEILPLLIRRYKLPELRPPRKAVCEILSFCQVFYSSLLYTFSFVSSYLDSLVKSHPR